MSGTAFHDAVAEIEPELATRFVFMSGDVLNPELSDFAASRGVTLLAKPFDIDDRWIASSPSCSRPPRGAGRLSPAPLGAGASARRRAGSGGTRGPSSGRGGRPSTRSTRTRRRPELLAAEASWSTSMIPLQTSRPMKSASASGPIGWLRPIFAPVSMSSAVPTPSSNARIASPRNGISIRLTMNPGRSAETMTCLPSSADELADRGRGRVRRRGAADELDERHDRHGAEEVHPDERRRGAPASTAAASSSIEIELVFEARSAPGGAIASISLQNPRLTSRSSKIASTTRSAAAAASGRRSAAIRASVASRSSGLQPPLRDRPVEVAGDPIATGDGPAEFRLVENRRPCRSPRGPGRCRGPSARHPRRRRARSSSPEPTRFAKTTGRSRLDRRAKRRQAAIAAKAADTRNVGP